MKVMENDVLFQKIANRWFAFTEINNELVYAALPENMDPKTDSVEFYSVVEEQLNAVASTIPAESFSEAVA
jgi:hypothetical protein